jgi:hypothetical protein
MISFELILSLLKKTAIVMETCAIWKHYLQLIYCFKGIDKVGWVKRSEPNKIKAKGGVVVFVTLFLNTTYKALM